MLSVDILLLALAWYFAHLVRFDFVIPAAHINQLKLLPYVVAAKITVFYIFDLYRGMWRYTSIADLLNVIKAASISSLVIICFVLFSTRFQGFSRSVFIIDWCLTILLTSGFRLSVRIYFDFVSDNVRDGIISCLDERRKMRILHCSGIADLATCFCIERSLVEYHLSRFSL